jgi:hypothetical protein
MRVAASGAQEEAMDFDASDKNEAGGQWWPAMRDLGNVARSWNNPLDLLTKLKRLMVERPLVGFAAAVLVGVVLHGRVTRHR